ncbi:MAG: acyltransferase family protein [Candidatus Methanoperedens sp.]|nr:acyltransferase family protein [Candidatus Methanoperedens sp.]MCE8428977.1 acyltransferase family protein [Candidatus Methanoperedens sp.]
MVIADKPQAIMSARMFWLDWVRVLAMGVIFLFHSSRPFAPPSWHIMNPTLDLGFTLFDAFVSGWIMPLFFAVSGIAVYSSLAKRSTFQFISDRFMRLMIPFLFIGLFVILPVNVYYDAVFHRYFTGNFLSFYLGPYFTKYFPLDLNFSPTYFANSNQGVYLWYLFWLFVFSLATFNLFKWLAEERNRNRLSKLYAVCNMRGGILLLAVPLIIVNIAAVPPYFIFPSGYGGWKLPAYLVLFITAYVMASSPQFEESIEKNRVPALLFGIITSLLVFALATIVLSDSSALDRYYVPVSIVWALNGWCWVMAILGFGRKHLSFDHKYLKVPNELVLPFYVLHQSVIVAIAFYVVVLDLIVIEKYFLIVLASFSIIVALLYPISKFNLLRFLFGMRMKKRPS